MSAVRVGVALAGAMLAAWWGTRGYARVASTPGALSPPAPRLVRWGAKQLLRVFVFVQVGPITVVGRERVEALTGPLILAANHQHYADGPVLSVAMRCPGDYWTLVARGALRWGWGLGGRVLGPVRTICVDLGPGRGGTAFRTGVQRLVAGDRLLIFPEGWAHMDGARGTFKAGAVAMAQTAAARLGHPVTIVPVRLTYPRHPGAWITRLAPAWQYALTLLAFPLFRRGAMVIVGVPIGSDTLPADRWAATRVLEDAITRSAP